MSDAPPPAGDADARSGAGSAGRREPTEADLAGAQQVRYRRAPRYRLLIGLGALVGVVAAVVLTAVATPTATYGRGEIFGYLLAGLVLVGGLLGGLVGVLLERVVRGRG